MCKEARSNRLPESGYLFGFTFYQYHSKIILADT